jgi:hypothetical protein
MRLTRAASAQRLSAPVDGLQHRLKDDRVPGDGAATSERTLRVHGLAAHAAPVLRHGVAGAVIGNRFHLVSGMITSAGAMAMLDPNLKVHTASHEAPRLAIADPGEAIGLPDWPEPKHSSNAKRGA